VVRDSEESILPDHCITGSSTLIRSRPLALPSHFHLKRLHHSIQSALSRFPLPLLLGDVVSQRLHAVFLLIEFADVALNPSPSPPRGDRRSAFRG
jgi:hypothetical protein